jgi:hypothetical protein
MFSIFTGPYKPQNLHAIYGKLLYEAIRKPLDELTYDL